MMKSAVCLLALVCLAAAKDCKICQEVVFSDKTMQEAVGAAMGEAPCSSPTEESCDQECLTFQLDMTLTTTFGAYDYSTKYAMCGSAVMTCAMLEANMPDMSSAGMDMEITNCEMGVDLFGESGGPGGEEEGGTDTESSAATESCGDNGTNCGNWAASGYCNSTGAYYSYMAKNCAASCELCEGYCWNESEQQYLIGTKVAKLYDLENAKKVCKCLSCSGISCQFKKGATGCHLYSEIRRSKKERAYTSYRYGPCNTQ